MTRYEETFHQLETRGIEQGSATLIGRLETDLTAGTIVATQRNRRQIPAMAWAAIAFVSVLVIGFVATLFVGPPAFIADRGVEIEWFQQDAEAFPTVTSGHNGFLRPSRFYAPAAGLMPHLEFSSDGEQWQPTNAEFPDGSERVVAIVSTKDTWMIATDNVRTVLISEDGLEWTTATLPDDAAGYPEWLVASPDGFLLFVNDVFDQGPSWWRSTDGTKWAAAEIPSGTQNSFWPILGTSGGFAAVQIHDDRSDGASIWISPDATNWTEGQLEIPSDLAGIDSHLRIQTVSSIGDRWIALAEVNLESTGPELHAWTSDDGQRWTSAGRVTFDDQPGSVVHISPALVFNLSRNVDWRSARRRSRHRSCVSERGRHMGFGWVGRFNRSDLGNPQRHRLVDCRGLRYGSRLGRRAPGRRWHADRHMGWPRSTLDQEPSTCGNTTRHNARTDPQPGAARTSRS